MKIPINNSDKFEEVKYFIIEPLLKGCYAVVGETEDSILFYPLGMMPHFDSFTNANEMRCVGMPNGERYETGEPNSQPKHKLTALIESENLDVTNDYWEIHFILTGKKRKAFNTNIIG